MKITTPLPCFETLIWPTFGSAGVAWVVGADVAGGSVGATVGPVAAGGTVGGIVGDAVCGGGVMIGEVVSAGLAEPDALPGLTVEVGRTGVDVEVPEVLVLSEIDVGAPVRR